MATDIPSSVLQRYLAAYDGEIQGCCPVIADELQRTLGGQIVAGFITFAGGPRRPHWWVEVDGKTIDPMGDHVFGEEPGYRHIEEHRDRVTFQAILPMFEYCRVPPKESELG